jgi:tetratricopeptide (TPR) repeat protein
MVAALALAIGAIVVTGRPTLADHLRSEAQEELRRDPGAALRTATDSLSLNPDSLQAYYLKAAALARFDAYQPARSALTEAIDREPHNYVSWALLGDLAIRRGNFPLALRAYGRASRLNPRDRVLRALGSRRALLERLNRNPQNVRPLIESAVRTAS